MRIGIVYDVKEDYFTEDGIGDYWDFATLNDINTLSSIFKELGHDIQLIGNYTALNQLIKSNRFDFDLIYNTCEGFKSRNREAIVPILLELNEYDYIGSDAYALSTCLNKLETKLIANYLGIRTPDFIFFSNHDLENLLSSVNQIEIAPLEYPLIVKPNCEGNSTGVFKVNNYNEFVHALYHNYSKYHQGILVEKYISGREITVPIIGSGETATVFGIVEIFQNIDEELDLFTTEGKLFEDTKYKNIQLSHETSKYIENSAIRIHNHIGCLDINRADFRLTEQGEAYFLELNPLPAIGIGGSFDTVGSSMGLQLKDILSLVIKSALSRKKSRAPKHEVTIENS